MFKQTTEYKSIQKKLVAAVAMVLVAAIMVVSSSYAWFTLSTAPEVKGITTSVGSNGNLEMALREVKDMDDIQTLTNGGEFSVGHNTTWGNLVDLSFEQYGLSEISLAPARLNVAGGQQDGTYTDVILPLTEEEVAKYAGESPELTTYNGYEVVAVDDDGNTITYRVPNYTYTVAAQAGLLKTPVYGTDGRVSALEADKSAVGMYNPTADVFSQATLGTNYGVLGIGTVSGLSDAELALRKAKNTVYTTIIEVGNDAGTSLSVNASDLANIMIVYTLNSDASFGATEYAQINNTIAQLEAMSTKLKNALDQTVIAVGVFQGQTITSVSWDGTNINTVGGTITWPADTDTTNALYGPYASLKQAYADWEELNAILTSARNGMPDPGLAAYYWNDSDANTNNGFYDAVQHLMTTNDLTIVVGSNTYSVAEFKTAAFSNITAIINNGLTVEIGKGKDGTGDGGVYGRISEFVGEIKGDAMISVDGNVVSSTLYPTPGTMVEMPTNMKTNMSAPEPYGYHLVYANTWLPNLALADDGNNSGSSLSDLYGYMINFAFRTNATGSSLMLQTTPKDRIDNTSSTAATMGGGSYMEFTLGEGNGYTMEQMLELVQAIRVVFMDDDYKILAIGAMQIAKTQVGEQGKADEITDTTTYDFIDANGTAWKVTGATISEGKTVRADLNLYNFSFSTDGVLTLGTKIEPNANGATALTELIANQPFGLSTLVYLDGDKVDNGDVAINGNSMTGTINLQFASSATLVPMDYTFTEDEGEEEGNTLAAPAPSLSGDTLSWSAIENATSYKVGYQLAGGEMGYVDVGNVTSVNLSTVLSANDVEPGTYTIVVVASASGYTDGVDLSQAETYAFQS